MTMIYPAALTAAFLDGMQLDQGLTAVLVSAGYTASPAHTSLSDVPEGAREASAEVDGLQVQDGVVTADPTKWESANGDAVRAVVLVRGAALIAYLDDFGAGPGQTSLALNGSDITATWPSTGLLAP